MEEIKQQFIEVIRYSQDIPEPKVGNLFTRWYEAKKNIIENAFGGELIYKTEEKVTFELDQREKSLRFKEFKDWIYYNLGNDALVDFLKFSEDAFYNNMTPEDYICENGVKIQKGTKIVKAFKFFEKNKDVLHDLQSKASRLIQEDKISGRLCFSVHPLDFLSTSENAHNWRSCHSLDGDYRAGNLSYMVDKSTFMCYLEADGDTNISGFPESVKWNSKKWRMLLFLSNDWSMIAAGRQYPFTSQSALEVVRKELGKIGFNFSRWRSEITSYKDEVDGIIGIDPHVRLAESIIPTRHLIIDYSKEPIYYNDLLRSSCYDPLFGYMDDRWRYSGHTRYDYTRFYIGGIVPCLYCGEDEITSCGTMMCNNCECEYGSDDNENFFYCEVCGRREHVDNGHWLNDDMLVCEECFNETRQCAHCGDHFFDDDIFYDREHECYICRYCKTEMEEY